MAGIEAVTSNSGNECGQRIGRLQVSTGGWVSFYCTKPKGHHTEKVTWIKSADSPLYPPGSVFEWNTSQPPPTAKEMAERGFQLQGDPCEFRCNGLVVKEER